MTKGQLFAVLAVLALVIVIIVLIAGHHSQSSAPAAPTPAQITAANDCITLCQTVYDGLGTGANGPQEQACENTCYKSAGISATTTAQ